MKLGARNKSGCSPQYCEYSESEVGDKMNGGAVNVERSPLNDVIDFRNDVQVEELAYPDMARDRSTQSALLNA